MLKNEKKNKNLPEDLPLVWAHILFFFSDFIGEGTNHVLDATSSKIYWLYLRLFVQRLYLRFVKLLNKYFALFIKYFLNKKINGFIKYFTLFINPFFFSTKAKRNSFKGSVMKTHAKRKSMGLVGEKKGRARLN